MVKKAKAKALSELRLDLGCGTRKKPDHIGIDRIAFPGVDHVLEVGRQRLPFKTDSVTSIWSSHFVEHLPAVERIFMLNEAFRVLKPGGAMTMVVPHWASSRAYGDPTHQWPPIGEMWFYYLSRAWRLVQAPHTDVSNWAQGYSCDFDATWGYGVNPTFQVRSQEAQEFAANFYREAVFDLQATLTKKG